MEELEINPEGQTPQEPEAASPEQAEPAAVGESEAPDVWPSPGDSAAQEPSEVAAPELDTEVVAAEVLAQPGEAPVAPMEEAPFIGAASSDQPDASIAEPAEIVDAAQSEPSPEASPEPSRELPEPSEQGAPEAPDLWPSPIDASIAPVEELPAPAEEALIPALMEDAQLMAVLEAVIYVAEEPLTLAQIAAAIAQPAEHVGVVLRQLIAEMEKPERGIAIREVAGGFKMATKPEHHEAVRNFVKSLKPPMKLSLPALETLAVIAYKQPVTAPEIMEIRGVQGAGVLKTLLDRKLIAVAGRKNVIGKPILYKTTRDFLIQFGLNDVNELPSLKEFEEIRRMAFADSEPAAPATEPESVATQPAPTLEAAPVAAPEPES